IEVVSERCEGARVARVVLEIGLDACVLPGAIEFAFSLASEATPVEGARLEIVRSPGDALRIHAMELA
ncbi:MAG TPA: hydrogenase/urease maturation nickel metallochaperone HypA, partial [Planctomycetota bacterium]|nr:hydrogenase/urease maturation nickel metallochaperone HypA [Planctomycetota bacterium]